jgi:hypothetical protein
MSGVKLDCDAISVVIRTKEMTQNRIKTIEDFFALFGTKMTFSCGLPNKTTGAQKKDSVFSCNGSKSQHVTKEYQGLEMLVIDTPIKVALHKECKDRLVSNLAKEEIYLSPSGSDGLCFNPKAVANKPNYQGMVKAIIQSCYTNELKEHYIHVADFGMKLNIDPGSPDCPLDNFFNVITRMRNNGLQVETPQLDFGFMIPAGINRLIQLATTIEKKFHGILQKSDVQIYPIHEVSTNAMNNKTKQNTNTNTGDDDSENPKRTKNNNIQHGTVSMKKKDWKACNEVILISSDDDDIDNEEYPDDNDNLVGQLYSARQNSNNPNNSNISSNVTIHSGCVYSVKAYSSISHVHMQNRMKMPLSYNDMSHIGNRQFIHLQNLLKHIESSASRAFDVVKTNGICSRIEISIRPHSTDTAMREHGHYNDFMAHVYQALCELFNETRYKMTVHYLEPQICYTKALSLISEIKPLLKMRSSLMFNEIYASNNMTLWLQAHVSLLLMTVGFAPEFNLRFLKAWLNDDNRHDPYHHGPRICNIIHSIIKSRPLNVGLSNVQRRHLHRTLKENNISNRSIDVLMDYIDNFKTYPNPTTAYKKLSLKDKLILSMNLMSIIVPEITRLFTNGKVMQNTETEVEPEENNENIDHNHHWWLLLGSHSTAGEYRTTHQIKEASLPTDPLCYTVHCLLEMDVFPNHGRATFTRLLCDFVLQCHENKFKFGNEMLHPLDNSKTIARQILVRGALEESHNLSNLDLQILCKELSIKLNSQCSNKNNIAYLQAICKTYSFPCDGVLYNTHTMSNEDEKNKCLNQILGKDLVVNLNLVCGNSENMYYRNTDNTAIRIARPESIAKEGIPTLISSTEIDNGYTFMSSCVNANPSNNNEVLRNMLHKKISTAKEIHHWFLTSNGKGNNIFDRCHTLSQLEKVKKFKLLLNNEYPFDILIQAFNFQPHIILPFVSMTYEIDITCYDKVRQKTYIYVYHQKRSIAYEFHQLDIHPSIHCDIIMSIEIGEKYIRHTIAHGYTPFKNNQTNYKEKMKSKQWLDSFHSFQGRTRICTNYTTILPDINTSRARSFYQSWVILLTKIKYKFISKSKLFGIISFLDELSSCGQLLNLFDHSVTSDTKVLSYPLRTITKYLSETGQQDLSHKVLCPLFCLIFKQTIAVFEFNESKRRQTHIYAFNHVQRRVFRVTTDGYKVYQDYKCILYLFMSLKNTGYYMPCRSSGLIGKSYLSLLCSKYSYLEGTCFDLAISTIASTHNMSIIMEESLEEHKFRPHQVTAILHTNLINSSTVGISHEEMRQINIQHHAIILVFPFQKRTNQFDVCIVHHPHQNNDAVRFKLHSYFECLNGYRSYNFHQMKGLQLNDCESAFYMLIYMLIGHRSKCYSDFVSSIERLKKEEDICQKSREWVHEIMNKKRETAFIPSWLNQISENW